MNKALTPILLSLGLLVSTHALTAANGTYRWYAEDGTVQYSDIPPEGVEAEFIKFTSAGKSRGDENPKSSAKEGAESAADAGKSQEPKIYDEMEVMPEKDPALCKQAQQNLKALESARIRITEPDGSKRILTEDEKETQRENARKFIKIHC